MTVMGRKSALPLMLSPTALQRLFHWQGERAVAAAAEKFGLWFGISSLATVSMEEIGAKFSGPKMLQYYYHKDRGLNAALLEQAKAAKFDAVTLTVDTIVSGNRERCKRTGFTSPPRFTPASVWSYATKPAWAWNYLTKEKFDLPNLSGHVSAGSNVAVSVQDYFNTMLDPTMDWARCREAARRLGRDFLPQGHHVGRRCAPRGGYGLRCDHGLQPWRPATGRQPRARSTSSTRSCRRWATGSR